MTQNFNNKQHDSQDCEEIQIPKSLKNRISFKNITIQSLGALTKILNDQFKANAEVILLTTLGVIRGKIAEVAVKTDDLLKPVSFNGNQETEQFQVDISYVS